ncbi:type I secretion system permease/ATPase [Desulfovibrio inopinatus]|uniref:type I secretion system permease/ATPase n=1 Tax=Desulfovibrio inopinatus TaxID=102109 RepID=UPI000420A0E2|nr:type I secretion system permease/ATPase [Desulfovibrio inopinatus]
MRKILRQWLGIFLCAAQFSFFINILGLTFPVYMLQIYSRVLASKNIQTLILLTVIALTALGVLSLLTFLRTRILVQAGVEISKKMNPTVLAAMVKGASETDPGKYARGLSDIATVRNFLGGVPITVLFDIPWTPVYILVVFLMHPVLGMIGVIGALGISFFAFWNDRICREPITQANAVAGQTSKFIGTCLRNAPVVRGMGMISGVMRRVSDIDDRVSELQTTASTRSAFMLSVSSGFRMVLQVSIYGVGAYLAILGECTAGAMIASSIIIGKALSPVERGISSWRQMVESYAAYKRLDALFLEIKKEEPMELPPPVGALRLDNVSLRLKERTILQGISFSLSPGEALGIIGPSAAGKSTLCRMLLGVWKPSVGNVRLDGVDVYSWDQELLGPYIGYLPQEVELFSGTLSENIARMGEVDSEKVVAAAKLAQVHEMILKLPQGYDSLVGEGSNILSGGQKQRIGLARALYGDPKYLILDEPNSNLDEAGDKALHECLATLQKRKVTVIIVSHKPGILATVNKVLVLNEGKMQIFGPREAVFNKLMQKSPVQSGPKSSRKVRVAANQAAPPQKPVVVKDPE